MARLTDEDLMAMDLSGIYKQFGLRVKQGLGYVILQQQQKILYIKVLQNPDK